MVEATTTRTPVGTEDSPLEPCWFPMLRRPRPPPLLRAGRGSAGEAVENRPLDLAQRGIGDSVAVHLCLEAMEDGPLDLLEQASVVDLLTVRIPHVERVDDVVAQCLDPR